MAKRTPKIILFKEDHIGLPGVTEAVMSDIKIKRDAPLEAVTTMKTEFEPTPDTVLENTDFGISSLELSETEVDKLKKCAEIEDVIEDEMVFAFDPYDRPQGGLLLDEPLDLTGGDLDEAVLEIDEEDEEERPWSGMFDDLLDVGEGPDLAVQDIVVPDAAELDFLAQHEPALSEEDIAIEHALLEFGEVPLAEGLPGGDALTADLEPAKLAPAIRSLFNFFIEQDKPLTEIDDNQLESLLRTSRLQEALTHLPATRDVILPNIRQIYANFAWRFTKGAGARLAIIDTGIGAHPDLRIKGGVSFVPGRRSWRDDHGHGTHVAGIAAAALNNRGIVGVAPLAHLYAVKVLDSRGSGRLSWIINGLAWCYRRRMHVANLSLGSVARSHNPREYNRAYERIGSILTRRGTVLVAAAGNSNGPVGNPARCPSFMAVSAIDGLRRRARFSCFGPQVEICAPGVQILSTYRRGYRRMSGTSMASPHVAGTAALVKSRHRTWSARSIRGRILGTALDLGQPGRDAAFGYGQVNAYRAVR